MQISVVQIHSWDVHTQFHPSVLRNGILILLLPVSAVTVPASALSCFSDPELQILRSFSSASAQERFLKGHLLLKRVGSYCTGLPENSFSLLPDRHGKLTWKLPLSFNLTHSGDWIAAAFSFCAEIGIDLEDYHAKKTPYTESFLHRVFHPKELLLLERASALEQQALFFRLWTLKEALLKGTGDGLTVSTASFCLQPDSDLTDTWRAEDAHKLYTNWHLISFCPSEKCVCSLAYRLRRN